MAFKYTESSSRTTNGLQNGLQIPSRYWTFTLKLLIDCVMPLIVTDTVKPG